MKLGRTTKIRQNFFYRLSPFSSTPNNQNSAEFFAPSAHHSSFSIPVFHLSLWFNPSAILILILIGLGFRSYSRQSIIFGSTRPPSFYLFVPAHCASSTSSSYSSFHLVLLLRHSVHDSITLRSWPSWVCRVSNAHGGCDVYPLLAFLYLVLPVTSRPSSMFRSPSLSCFCNSSSPVIISCQSATVFLLAFVFVNVSTVSPLSFQYISPSDPCGHPFSGFMAPPFRFSVFSSVSVSAICYVFSASSSFPAQPGFLSASPFIPISAFPSLLSISGVLAAQPASSFLVASVYSTVVLLSTFSITPPRLISDFSVHRSSYRSSVSIASLWPDCGALVSCSVRRFRL